MEKKLKPILDNIKDIIIIDDPIKAHEDLEQYKKMQEEEFNAFINMPLITGKKIKKMEELKPKAKNYNPGSVSFASGFLSSRGDKGYFMVADYKKAKTILRKLLKEGRNIDYAEMGLDGDWNCNSMAIYENGKHYKYDCYDASIWAEPIMIVFYKDAPSETYSVWHKEDKKG
jgi:hypothetical protein